MKRPSSVVSAIVIGACVSAPLLFSAIELKIIPIKEPMPFTECGVIEEADFGYFGKIRGCVGWSFQFPKSNPYMIILRTLQSK